MASDAVREGDLRRLLARMRETYEPEAKADKLH
jgi:hypothetical protein